MILKADCLMIKNRFIDEKMNADILNSDIKKLLNDIGVNMPEDLFASFVSAPASTKYHGNYPGGLLEHSINVAAALSSLSDVLELEWKKDRSPLLIGLFHDLCKADAYVFTDDGIIHAELTDPGHGDRSVRMLKEFVSDLTEEEELCIRWHMGAFDEKENWNGYTSACAKYPNVLFTHTADMYASQVFEKTHGTLNKGVRFTHENRLNLP